MFDGFTGARDRFNKTRYRITDDKEKTMMLLTMHHLKKSTGPRLSRESPSDPVKRIQTSGLQRVPEAWQKRVFGMVVRVGG